MSDPKLLRARAEIEAILKREDIAAHVVLHNAPGQTEVFLKLDPTYSRLSRYEVARHGVSYRLRSQLADYGGDRDAQGRDLAATANMVSSLAQALAKAAVPMLSLAEQIDKATGAEHTPLRND